MPRERIPLAITVQFSDEHDENDVSCESLRLAPSVAAAAAEVRKRWSDEEKYQRRVTKVQPITYGRVDFP